MNTRHRWLVALLAVVALLLAACGGGTPQANEQPTAAALPATSAPAATAAPAPEPTAAPAAEPTAAPAAEPTAAPEATAEASGGAQAGGGEKIQIWVQGWEDPTGGMKKKLEAGATELGLNLELTENVEQDKVLAAIQAGNPPDLILFGGAAPDVPTMAREGLLMPLDDQIAKGGVNMDDIIPSAVSQCRYFGKLYCLPWGTDAYALFWNKDLFQEAGLDPEKPPQTLEEMAEFAKKLNKVDKDGNLGVAGFIPDFSWSHLDIYTRMFGGGFYNADGTKITLASEPVVQALEWEKQFYLIPGSEKVDRLKSGFGDYNSPQAGFYTGKVAMMVEGEWQPTFIKKFAPNLRYGVAPLPYPAAHPERKGTVVVAGTVMAIPSNVKDVDRAWKMFSWMEKSETVTDVMLNNGNLPTSKKGLVDQRFRQDTNFAVFLDLASGQNATGPVLSPIESEMGEKLGAIEESVNKGQVPDTKAELEKAQEELQPKLDEALKK